MSTEAIESAFRSTLRALLGPDARIVFENTTPQNTQRPYYRAHILPAETQNPTYGTDGIIRAVGIYQVSVVGDANVGSRETALMADGLLSGFFRGLTFAAGSHIIVVEKSWRSPAIQSVDSYTIPVSVRYWADIDRYMGGN